MKNKILCLCECAVMIALATALSFIKLWQMPYGGSVTLVSMLPIFVIAIKHRFPVAFGSAFVYSLIQLFQAIMEGDVFIYCEGAFLVALCVALDYLLPFSALCLAGAFKKFHLFKQNKAGELREVRDFGICIGIFTAILARFACHLITGAFIWGQWAPEGVGKWVYSLVYNGAYLGVEFILTLIVSSALLSVPVIRRILGLRKSQSITLA
jgi:thiamine transporter